MTAEILCLKSESVSDSQLYNECDLLSSALSNIGVSVPFSSYLEPDAQFFSKSVINAIERSNIIFVVGGCGSNSFGKDTLSKMLNIRLSKNNFCYEHMQNNINLVKFNEWENSVYIPDTAVVFPDSNGPFCSFAFKTQENIFVVIPDILYNFKQTVNEEIIPFIAKTLGLYFSFATIKAFEPNIQDLDVLVSKLCRRSKLNILTEEENGVVTINISSYGPSLKEADSICENAVNRINEFLKLDLFEIGQRSLSQVTVDSLKLSNLKISTAESCTGGMISEMITDVSGASEILEIGICAYSNRVKQYAIGVPKQILDTYGAISKETAVSLAKSIREISGADIGIGVTGVAGPSPSENKPVGTVYIALADSNNIWVRKLNANPCSSRESIRKLASNIALDLTRRYLHFHPNVMPGACAESEIKLLNSQPIINIGDYELKNTVNNEFLKTTPSSKNSEPHFNIDYNDLFHIEDNVAALENNEDVTDNSFEIFNITPPVQKSKKSKGLLKIILFVLLALIIVIGGIFASYFLSAQKDKNLIAKVQSIYFENTPQQAFNILKEQNDDYYAWIKNTNSDINLPVCYCNDNSFYLTNNFNKKSSRNGNLFFDKNCNLNNGDISKNLIIYGKNLNNGNMFAALNKYDNISYLTNCSTIKLDFGEETKNYKIFAVFIADSKQQSNENNILKHINTSFSSEESFKSFSNLLEKCNFYKSNIEISHTDKFLTLVTEHKDYDNLRFIVMAKQIDEDIFVEYSVNPNPLYPDFWYNK